MIGVRCDRCGAHFWAKDEAAGRSASCSRCGQILRVPAPPEESEPLLSGTDHGPVPPPEITDPPSLWLPRAPGGDDAADPMRELLKVARQIRFLLVVLIVIGLLLLLF